MTKEDMVQSILSAVLLALVAAAAGVFFQSKTIVICAVLGAACCVCAPIIMHFHTDERSQTETKAKKKPLRKRIKIPLLNFTLTNSRKEIGNETIR